MASARPVLAASMWFALSVAACSGGASPSTAPTPQPQTQPARILVVTYTTGFRHSSIDVAEPTLRNLGTTTGLYDTEFCRTADDVRTLLTPAHLATVNAIFFANTTGDLGIPNLQGVLDWIAAGHAFLGSHSASDTYHDSVAYLTMLGGEFVTHGAIVEADVKVDDPSHPSVVHLAPRFTVTDELYRFARMSRSDAHVLFSLDRVPADGVGDAGQPADLPLAWTRTYGSGRVFYTALGHREEVWQDARYQQHLIGAIRWALGR
jgi:type 1 glutamine amidotransferase